MFIITLMLMEMACNKSILSHVSLYTVARLHSPEDSCLRGSRRQLLVNPPAGSDMPEI